MFRSLATPQPPHLAWHGVTFSIPISTIACKVVRYGILGVGWGGTWNKRKGKNPAAVLVMEGKHVASQMLAEEADV